jgi:hypothetical protein
MYGQVETWFFTNKHFMNYILWRTRPKCLIAFTFTRPVADILIGIMTIRQNGDAFGFYDHYINRGIFIR